MNNKHSSKDLKGIKEGVCSFRYTLSSRINCIPFGQNIALYLFFLLFSASFQPFIPLLFFLSSFITFLSLLLDAFLFFVPKLSLSFPSLEMHFFYKLKKNQEAIKPLTIFMVVFQRQVVMKDSPSLNLPKSCRDWFYFVFYIMNFMKRKQPQSQLFYR